LLIVGLWYVATGLKKISSELDEIKQSWSNVYIKSKNQSISASTNFQTRSISQPYTVSFQAH